MGDKSKGIEYRIIRHGSDKRTLDWYTIEGFYPTWCGFGRGRWRGICVTTGRPAYTDEFATSFSTIAEVQAALAKLKAGQPHDGYTRMVVDPLTEPEVPPKLAAIQRAREARKRP